MFERHTSGRPVSQTIPANSQLRMPSAPDDDFEDYINASWIDSCTQKRLMIAASAPSKSTVCDFLHMIMEHNVKLVMKVCEDKVQGKQQCFKYTGKTVSVPDDSSAPSRKVSDSAFNVFSTMDLE